MDGGRFGLLRCPWMDECHERRMRWSAALWRHVGFPAWRKVEQRAGGGAQVR